MHFFLGFLDIHMKFYSCLKLKGLCSMLQDLNCSGVYCIACGWLHTALENVRCKYIKHLVKKDQ